MWHTINDKNNWDNLIAKQPHSSFLQSWEWGDFQMSLGRAVKRLNYNDELLAQAVKMPLADGKFYWYIPHGPTVLDKAELDSQVFSELTKTLGESGALFLRVDPLRLPDHPLTPSWVQEGELPHDTPPPLLRREIPATQPQCVRVLDLSQNEEEILAAMHQKTRYNINLAEKKGVVVKQGTVDNFLQLNKQTTSRDNFVPHHDAYYRQMAQALGEGTVKVWQAEFNGKVLASVMVMYFGDTAAYLHGASANEDRNLMAPYLLHWKIIQDAKQRGFRFYDLGGVNPVDEKDGAFKKSWQGITRFKAGFGGEVICYSSSFDLIYRPFWYKLYKLGRQLRGLLH